MNINIYNFFTSYANSAIGELLIKVLECRGKDIFDVEANILLSIKMNATVEQLKLRIHGASDVPIENILLIFCGSVLSEAKAHIPIDAFESTEKTDEDADIFRPRIFLYIQDIEQGNRADTNSIHNQGDIFSDTQTSATDGSVFDIDESSTEENKRKRRNKRALRMKKNAYESFDMEKELTDIGCAKFIELLEEAGYGNEGAFSLLSLADLHGHDNSMESSLAATKHNKNKIGFCNDADSTIDFDTIFLNGRSSYNSSNYQSRTVTDMYGNVTTTSTTLRIPLGAARRMLQLSSRIRKRLEEQQQYKQQRQTQKGASADSSVCEELSTEEADLVDSGATNLDATDTKNNDMQVMVTQNEELSNNNEHDQLHTIEQHTIAIGRQNDENVQQQHQLSRQTTRSEDINSINSGDISKALSKIEQRRADVRAAKERRKEIAKKQRQEAAAAKLRQLNHEEFGDEEEEEEGNNNDRENKSAKIQAANAAVRLQQRKKPSIELQQKIDAVRRRCTQEAAEAEPEFDDITALLHQQQRFHNLSNASLHQTTPISINTATSNSTSLVLSKNVNNIKNEQNHYQQQQDNYPTAALSSPTKMILALRDNTNKNTITVPTTTTNGGAAILTTISTNATDANAQPQKLKARARHEWQCEGSLSAVKEDENRGYCICCSKHYNAVKLSQEQYIATRRLINTIEIKVLLGRLNSTNRGYVKSSTLIEIASNRLLKYNSIPSCSAEPLLPSLIAAASSLTRAQQHNAVLFVQQKEVVQENLLRLLPVKWNGPQQFTLCLVNLLEELDRARLVSLFDIQKFKTSTK